MQIIFKPLFLMIFGLTLLMLGLIYDGLFAGIPYQDPSPEVYANWKFHGQIASRILFSGLIVIGLSILVFTGQKFKKLLSRDKT